MPATAKRSRARATQLRDRKRARRRHRERRQEAAADARPFGEGGKKGEAEKSFRRRQGAQQLRHDRRRRRGQANHDPAAQSSAGFMGFVPAGGMGERHLPGSKLFVGVVGPTAGQVMGNAIKFRGSRPDPDNPPPIKHGRRHPKGRNRSGRGKR
jgi:hypothetical protein